MCINESNSSIICKSPEEINEFLIGKHFRIYYQDFSFVLTNYSDPVLKNYKYDYQLVTTTMRKEVSLFIREADFSNDDNYFMNDDNIQGYYEGDYLTLDFDEIADHFEFNENNNVPTL